MSMTPYDGENDDDAPEPGQEQFEAEALALQTRWDDSNVEAVLRKLGVYAEHMHVIPMPHPSGRMSPALAVLGKVNRVAFSDRVINPEAASVDGEFRKMAIHATDDDHVNTLIQIQKNLAEGRDALDDGDDADDE